MKIFLINFFLSLFIHLYIILYFIDKNMDNDTYLAVQYRQILFKIIKISFHFKEKQYMKRDIIVKWCNVTLVFTFTALHNTYFYRKDYM